MNGKVECVMALKSAYLINTLQITYLTAVKRILKILKDGYLKKGKTLW